MAATGVPSARGRPVVAKYDVQEEIGHGGMATVYRAHDPRLGRDVAVKVIHPHLRHSVEAKARFHVEAKAVAKLRHPCIVEVFDVSDEEEPEQYLVVELVRGVTLRKLFQTRPPVPPEVAAVLGIDLLAALAHAHAHGVIHRDIKPENVMLEHVGAEPSQRPTDAAGAGERVRVKLMDFGIAKLLDAQGVTATGQVLGSPAHMAPEQIEGAEVDGRADVFGLGVLLYECVVGHLPFEGNNPAQVLRRVLEGIYPSAERENVKIGKRWSALLDRALARSPADRFPDAAAMQAALADELALLGLGSGRAGLEAWMDDPVAYTQAHDAALVPRLCELGRLARKEGRALDAAAHFNRALAYAPHDPALLKIVVTMHRERAWRSVAVRAAPITAVSLALGTAAYFGTNALRHRPAPAASAAPRSPLAAAAPPAATSAAPDPPPAPRPAPREPPRQAAPAPTAKPVERTITIDELRPPFGVLASLDGAPIGEVHQGLSLPLDGKAHDLRFTCMKDECEPWTKSIPAGDEPRVSLVVALSIKPAALVVDGDPSLVYGLEEFPQAAIRVGVPTSVPIPHGNYAVHVVERSSGRRATGRLDPGKEAHVQFSPMK